MNCKEVNVSDDMIQISRLHLSKLGLCFWSNYHVPITSSSSLWFFWRILGLKNFRLSLCNIYQTKKRKTSQPWFPDCDLCPFLDNRRILPQVWLIPAQTLCKCLYAKSVFVSICASVLVCFHLCMNGLWLWGCTCPWVCVWAAACVEHVLAFSEEQQGSNKD